MSKLVVGEIEDANGANPYSPTLGTENTTTGGTEVDFTSIPSGVKQIRISVLRASLSGVQEFYLQLGDAGGIETSGYDSIVLNDAGSGNTATGGFILIHSGVASHEWAFKIDLSLVNASNNTWHCQGTGLTGSGVGAFFSGYKDLSAEIDRLRFTQTSADTIDLNEGVNIQYM